MQPKYYRSLLKCKCYLSTRCDFLRPVTRPEKNMTENIHFTANRYLSDNTSILWNSPFLWTKTPLYLFTKNPTPNSVIESRSDVRVSRAYSFRLKTKEKNKTKTWGRGVIRKITSLAKLYAQQSSNTTILMTFRQCQTPFDCIFKAIFLQNFPAFIRKLPRLTKLSLGFNVHVFMCLFFAC